MMKTQIKISPLFILVILACFSNVYAANTSELEERIIALEKKAKKTEQKNKRKFDSIKRKMAKSEDRLRISGFMSAGLTKSTDKVESFGVTFPDEFAFDPDSMVGLQFDYRISDDFSATVQTIAKGGDYWDIDAEWAYIKYQKANNWYVRGGRLRLPFYLYSESLDVGHTYPWARPPIGLYQTAVSTLEGLDLFYSFDTMGWKHDIQTYVGTSKDQIAVATLTFDITINDLYGIVYSLSNGPWLARLATNRFTFKLNNSDIDFNGEDIIKTNNAALKYEDENLLISAEYGHSYARNNLIANSSESVGLTTGYRFGQWMPYAVHVSNNSLDEKPTSPTPSSGRGNTLGIRYDINSSVALKVQTEHLYDFEGTQGPFSPNAGAEEAVDIYTIVIDAVF